MPTIDGLPLHPLVIHAVVVLLPLAAVGAVAMAVRAAWRRQLGVPVLLVAVVGVGAVPVASASGTALRASMGGGSPLVAEHAARAGFLLPAAVLFLLLLGAAVLLDRRPERGRIAAGLSAASAAVGLAVAGLVVWIGHAGASAVWS